MIGGRFTISAGNRTDPPEWHRYGVFLFSDVLIYGTMYCIHNGDVRVNVHRVIQIAFCHLLEVDRCDLLPFDSEVAFRIVNPQKEVVFIADSPGEKHCWVEEITEAIVAARRARCSLIESLVQAAESHS